MADKSQLRALVTSVDKKKGSSVVNFLEETRKVNGVQRYREMMFIVPAALRPEKGMILVVSDYEIKGDFIKPKEFWLEPGAVEDDSPEDADDGGVE